MTYQLGYCTNVHAGATWEQTQQNLHDYAVRVRQLVAPDGSLGVGIWLAAQAAHELWEAGRVEGLRIWLRQMGLIPYTMNGFPYGNFHQPKVKHKVYQPTWRQQPRLDYTVQLARLLAHLLDEGDEGSISTLPIQWGQPPPTPEELSGAAVNLALLAQQLERIEKDTGRRIYVCLEPEPGCIIQRSSDAVRFFEDYLFGQGDEQTLRRHIRVCHDICHASVMFELQEDALRTYAEAGIAVGKMQISSAIIVPLEQLGPADRPAALEQLELFAEDRYLHQTSVRWPDGRLEFSEDLPQLLARPRQQMVQSAEWRIHFHVPVYLSEFGLLRASQDDIRQALQAAGQWQPQLKHLEVETYAWSVLPDELQKEDLAEGIADEIRWFQTVLA